MHEKSILLMLAPAAPLVLLDPAFFCFVQIMGAFTMFPLLIKDNLRIAYVCCCLHYVAVVSLLDRTTAPPPSSAVKEKVQQERTNDSTIRKVKLILIGISCIGECVIVNSLFLFSFFLILNCTTNLAHHLTAVAVLFFHFIARYGGAARTGVVSARPRALPAHPRAALLRVRRRQPLLHLPGLRRLALESATRARRAGDWKTCVKQAEDELRQRQFVLVKM